MTDFNNLTPTGRKTSGPTADLIELAVPDGNIQTAIVYNDAYHAHTGLTTDVELVQSFMEFPMVDGLSDMTRAVIGKGILQFDTGSCHGPVRPYSERCGTNVNPWVSAQASSSAFISGMRCKRLRRMAQCRAFIPAMASPLGALCRRCGRVAIHHRIRAAANRHGNIQRIG